MPYTGEYRLDTCPIEEGYKLDTYQIQVEYSLDTSSTGDVQSEL
jgi:hypothetical protein